MSTEVLAVEPELPVAPERLAELRRARRHRRVAEVHWVDALYRVYITALLGSIAVIAVAGSVGDAALTRAQVADVTAHGPAVVGVLAALAVAVGLRSGSRGGPLALEAADVRHVLLSPIDRNRALRAPAWRQVRSALFVATLLGATIGLFARRRFPDEDGLEWVASGAAAMAAIVGLAYGSALVASGRRIPRWAATLAGLVLIGWAAADVAGSVGDVAVPASPARAVGWLALAPLDEHWVSAIPAVVALVLVVVGLGLVGGLSVEAAERRTALVGQIRFAATLQDVRTVLVLRRQLSADRPRSRPWIALGRRGSTRPIPLRAVQGILRFPASRLARLLLLALAGGAALRGTWSGTAPLVIVAGICFWLAGLDLVEPLAQEVDHPSRRELYRHPGGGLYVGLLVPSFVVSVLVGLIAGGVAILPGDGAVPVGPGLSTGILAALAGAAGAVVNVVGGAPSHKEDIGLIAPEIAGMKQVLKAVLPLAVAIVGTVPLLVVQANENAGRPTYQSASTAWIGVAGLIGLVVAYVHQREEIAAWWSEAMEANTAARRGPDDDEEDDDEEEDDEEDGR